MTANVKYEAWTWRAVKARVVEMADTLRLSPSVKLPKEYGNSMPDTVREAWKDAQPTNSGRFRERPSAAALDRMEAVFGWINGLPNQADRHLIYDWSFIKVRKGLKINALYSEKDMEGGIMRRQIRSICQQIANDLNRLHIVRLNSEDCAVSENEGEHGQSDVTSDKCATHWIAPGAKPIHDPYSPELADLIARIEKANEQREKREARRRKKLAAYEPAAPSGQQAA